MITLSVVFVVILREFSSYFSIYFLKTFSFKNSDIKSKYVRNQGKQTEVYTFFKMKRNVFHNES